MIYSTNQNQNSIWLTDEFNFGIWCGIIGQDEISMTYFQFLRLKFLSFLYESDDSNRTDRQQLGNYWEANENLTDHSMLSGF